MRSRRPGTLYARLTSLQAMAVLGSLVLCIDLMLFKYSKVKSIDTVFIHQELSDSQLYSSVASRVGAGEGYYEAAASELRARGYTTDSVFNWRLPVYAWIFGKFPGQSWARAVLVACVLAAVMMAGCSVAGEGWALKLAAVSAMAFSYGWVLFPEPAYYMELWCGLIMFISLACHFRGWTWLGTFSGMAALVLRELAAPFCVVSLWLVVREKRTSQAAAWLAFLSCYFVAYIMHYNLACRQIAHVRGASFLGWVAFGGPEFVLSTCRMNYVLAILPAWCTVLFVPLSLLGLIGWPSRQALPIKVVTILYLALFSVLGRPYNSYWGWLCVPMMVIGAVWAPLSIFDLVIKIIVPDGGRACPRS